VHPVDSFNSSSVCSSDGNVDEGAVVREASMKCNNIVDTLVIGVHVEHGCNIFGLDRPF